MTSAAMVHIATHRTSRQYHPSLSASQSQSINGQQGLPEATISDNQPMTASTAEILFGDEYASELDEHLMEKLTKTLKEKIEEGDKMAAFQLGQLLFEQESFKEAETIFEIGSKMDEKQCTYQLAVIHLEGLVEDSHPEYGVDLLSEICDCNSADVVHLRNSALYLLGRAHFYGVGVRRSEPDAERLWLLAADARQSEANAKAQSSLGMFYSRPDTLDLDKAFFWHSEACGNGSLESQGALGVIYLWGVGRKEDPISAFECLKEASDRGNVYAMGNLTAHYFRKKFFTKSINLAAKLISIKDPEKVASETDCEPEFVRKGLSIGCFFYARCAMLGLGMKLDEKFSKKLYKLSVKHDAETCAQLQKAFTTGLI